MKKVFSIVLVVITALSVLVFSGCEKEQIKVTINDMLTESSIQADSGSTVEEILKKAEVKADKKDKVTPALNKEITKNTTITIARYAEVKVVYDGEEKVVSLVGGTVKDAVEQSKFNLDKNYSLNYKEEEYVTDGMEIQVTKMIKVKLIADKKTKNIQTESCTVKEFLEKQGVELGKKDIVTPPLKKKIKSDTTVTVKRVTEKTVTKTEAVSYETVYQTSASMASGSTQITQQGVNGEKKITYKMTYVDGKLKSKKVEKEEVTKEPVNEIITQGSKVEAPATTQAQTQAGGKTIVSKQRVDDCDGSGHGYYVITWSDGSTTYETY